MIGDPRYWPAVKRLHRERGHDSRITGCIECHEAALAEIARPTLRVVR